jgi:hypothetical protein
MAMMTTVERILAKAQALEAQAAALRLAAELLGTDVRRGKQGTLDRTLKGAMALRHAQTNGHAPALEPLTPTTTGKKKRAPAGVYTATKARRAKKRAQIVAILRDHGKPMPIALLAEAARKQGIDSLTGISGAVRSGQLKRTKRQGQSYYSLGAGARPA